MKYIKAGVERYPLVEVVLLFCIVVIGLTQGLMQKAGVHESIVRILIEVLSIGLFFYVTWVRGWGYQEGIGYHLLIPVGVAALSGVISGWLHNSSLVEIGFFLRGLVLPAVLLVAILNVRADAKVLRWLVLVVVAVVLLQIPVAILKYVYIGVNEKYWLGTLGHTAGQLGVVFPMIVLSIILPVYFRTGNVVAALLIIIFALIPVVNEKRVVIFLLPAMITCFFVLFIVAYSEWRKVCARFLMLCASRVIFLFAVCVITWILSIKLIPSLQFDSKPIDAYDVASMEVDHAHGGFLTAAPKVLQYSMEYLMRDYSSPMNISRSSVDDNENIQLGRFALIKSTFDVFSNCSSLELFIGFGAGAINPSKYLGEHRDDILYDKFGLRGTYSSAFSVLFEAGVVGVFAMITFYLMIFFMLFRHGLRIQHEPGRILFMGVVLMSLVVVFDYFAYSVVVWSSYAVAPLYFFAIAVFLRCASCGEIIMNPFFRARTAIAVA